MTSGRRASWKARTLVAAAVLVAGAGSPSGSGTALAQAAPESSPTIARIVSVENIVETRRAAKPAWESSTLRAPLFQSDRVRTGPESRASILYGDQTVHRLNQKSEIEFQPPVQDRPSLIKILIGGLYYLGRRPKQFDRIETPSVTTVVKGTEFVVTVEASGTTTVTILDGVVEAFNPFGSVTAAKGEQVYAEPGKPPTKRIVLRPRDAVAWAFYYPRVLGGSDAVRLRAMGPSGAALARAAELLSSGQVDEARPLVEEGRRLRPDDPLALALASVIELTTGRKEEAMTLARQAVADAPTSSAAALALSISAQAAFDIALARAMAEKAAELDPASSIALARAAELRMAEGDLAGAAAAAAGAVARTPEDARALSVLGFVELALFRSASAETLFESAVQADSSLALARVGLGLARIRRGRLRDGREEMQIATSLDPDDSLLRSYLAKAYYEEKRIDDAGKELAIAKELDPQDPTPYLYDAVRKQNDNRPVEALEDLRVSIERNDRRAVYRSRLLLDQDLAVRGADLARIYNDLGFDQLGVVTARRSADENQANYSSHLFLAGSYRNLSSYTPAFLSETLQARVYQPVSVNAARPDVVNETVSFNEYTALFDRPRTRAFARFSYGRTDVGIGDLFKADEATDENLSRIDESDIRAGEVTVTSNGDRYAAAFASSKFTTDGFRFNTDESIRNHRLFFQFSPSDRDSVQINALVSRQATGEVPLGIMPQFVDPLRLDSRLLNVAAAYHRSFGPASDLAVTLIHNRTEQVQTRFALDTPPGPATVVRSEGILKGEQLELQQVLRFRRSTLSMGAGGFIGEQQREDRTAGPPVQVLTATADDRLLNAYAYWTVRALGPLEATIGAAVEHVVSPSGVIAPRDAMIDPAAVEFTATKLSPKLGLSLDLPTRTTVRGALFDRLSPALGRLQTLEPTQVSGFNQFFREPGGTRSRSYGFGVDQEVGRRLFGGVSLLRRRLAIPEIDTSPQQEVRLVAKESFDVFGSAYVNATIGRCLAASVEYSYERRKFDFLLLVPQVNFRLTRLVTRRLTPELRLILPSGLFGSIAATRYRQTRLVVDGGDPVDDGVFDPSIAFTVFDARLGYRLPRRLGSLVLDIRNATDREFEPFEQSLEDVVVPARQATFSMNITL